jgi:TonB family protein
MEGQYQEVWISPDKWRNEFVLADFQQVEIGSSDSKWVSRNLDFNPRPSYLLAIALNAFAEPKISTDEKVLSIRKKKSKGSEWRCLELSAVNGPKRELCFDDSGALVQEEYLRERFEYGNFATYGEKIYPRTIRVFSDDRQVLDITADELFSPINAKTQLFQPAPGADRFAACERWPATPSKKVPPSYPQAARQAHQQGTVTLYAVIGRDGHIEKTRVLESGGQSLDQATVDAVQKWIYPPVACGTQPDASEVEIRVNYSLSTY